MRQDAGGPGSGGDASRSPAQTRPAPSVFDAGHPSPNAGSVAAAGEAPGPGAPERAARRAARAAVGRRLRHARRASRTGITLADKIETSTRLMTAGARDSRTQLRQEAPLADQGRAVSRRSRRTDLTLALSDVHGPVADDPSVIGSGPTVPDASTFADAHRHRLEVAGRAASARRAYLERGLRGRGRETVKPGDSRLDASEFWSSATARRRRTAAGARRRPRLSRGLRSRRRRPVRRARPRSGSSPRRGVRRRAPCGRCALSRRAKRR